MRTLVPPTPACLDPRVPAIVVFRDAGNPRTVAVFRKTAALGQQWSFCMNNGASSRPNFLSEEDWLANQAHLPKEIFNDDGYLVQRPEGYNWIPMRFRDLSTYSRRAMFSTVASRIHADKQRHHLAEPGYLWANCKGINFYNAIDFAVTRGSIREFSDAIRAALKVYADTPGWSEERDAARELREQANSYHSTTMRGKFVDAVNVAFENNLHDTPLQMCDCGHVELDGEATEDHARSTYCEGCAEDLQEIDGEYYNEDDCYYWDSDGEYHTHEEPEEDDDDDDDSSEHCDLIKGWRGSTGSLWHDRTFTSSTGGDFIMGVELEVESRRGYVSDAAQDSDDHFNSILPGASRNYVTLKEDGSLGAHGFEIVTAARKLEDHLTAFGSWAPHSSLRAWNPGTCGVHVHIDSRAFSGLTLGKFLMFINDNKNEGLITAIAGRHPLTNGKARDYCASMDQEVLNTPAKALKGGSSSRYRMTNLTNLSYPEMTRLGVTIERDSKGDYSTVELRIFRASLKKERLLAQIEFTHAAVMFCRTASWDDLTKIAFLKWLKGTAGQYKNLAKWFGVTVVRKDTRSGTTPQVVPSDADEAYA